MVQNTSSRHNDIRHTLWEGCDIGLDLGLATSRGILQLFVYCLLRVKTSKAQNEHMLSGLRPEADSSGGKQKARVRFGARRVKPDELSNGELGVFCTGALKLPRNSPR